MIYYPLPSLIMPSFTTKKTSKPINKYLPKNESKVEKKKNTSQIDSPSSIQVDIIIPTFNRSSTLNRAIQSVFNQQFKHYILWIVDDGSTDGYPSGAEKMATTVSSTANENYTTFREYRRERCP